MFSQRFISYLKHEKRYSPHTVTAYENDLAQFFAFLKSQDADKALTDITHHDIRAWMVQLVEDCGPRTVNRKVATLRKYFKFLLQENQITVNPASRVKTPKIAKQLPVVVEEAKLSRMLDNAETFTNDFKGLRDKLVIELLFGTGIRLAELLGIKETDYDARAGTIKVLGKRNKERIVPVNAQLQTLIADYLNVKKSENFSNNSLTMVVTNKGADAYPKLIYLIVRNYLSAISTQDKKSPHVLRHTFATALLNNGADLNAIKELLGHASLSATQVYTHNSAERLKSIYKLAHPKA
ncbi:tyrosine-type recombinase/integrase [Mucilaginibacter ginkgonis]|uniref:Tyrosine recombinase XerC n=1 Tax=Mucilaginibacter ginkgonis TaxID=2682091 RepID=A0A6I4HXM3_9SPHI|nr:tyrosine-type recombinase/integrase [Mucilaginibacter ginkgonis]QQL48284.1 tyrosine-type recombinase/integrase [Mucilaginibacter ginkgonis]